jgi:hypothetical protein
VSNYSCNLLRRHQPENIAGHMQANMMLQYSLSESAIRT